MYQQQIKPKTFISKEPQFNEQGSTRKCMTRNLAWWLGGIILLNTGFAIGGVCPNTVSGVWRTERPAVYSDCGTSLGLPGSHNIMYYQVSINLTPSTPSNLSPPPGADASPLSYVEQGLYQFDSDGQCSGVSGSLNGLTSIPTASFKYYCAVWRDGAGREQRISAQWRGTHSQWGSYSMTDTAIIDVDPKMSLSKSAQPVSYVLPGDNVVYTFLVENTGNVDLTAGTVSDDLDGLGAIVCNTSGNATISSLVVGAIETCTATYVTTPAAFEAGSVSNTASVIASDPSMNPVVADSNEVIINKLDSVCYEGALTIPDGTVFSGAGTTVYSSTVSIDTEFPATSGVIIEAPHVLELHAPTVEFNSLFDVESIVDPADSGRLKVITEAVDCAG